LPARRSCPHSPIEYRNSPRPQPASWLRGHLKDFGRDLAAFALDAWIRACRFDPYSWAADCAAWRRLGATITMLYPTYELPDFGSQIDLLKRFKETAAG